jgi:hypothetical protein
VGVKEGTAVGLGVGAAVGLDAHQSLMRSHIEHAAHGIERRTLASWAIAWETATVTESEPACMRQCCMKLPQ